MVHSHVFRENTIQLSSRPDIARISRADKTTLHTVVFFVRQKNIDELTRILHDVSDPLSPNYGQHLTREEVADLTSCPESRDALVSYLFLKGASVVSESLSGEYITASAPTGVWEKMLNTEFFIFHKTHFDQLIEKVVRAEKYSVPRELNLHVQSVFNAIEMPLHSVGSLPKMARKSEFKTMSATLIVPSAITPYKIKSYYNMSNTLRGSINSTQAIFAGVNQYFSPNDLTQFQMKFGLPLQPVSASIGNHSSNAKCIASVGECAEFNIDLQYIMAMSPGSPTIAWYTDNSFLDWLIAIANTPKPPLVLSISYGALEKDFTTDFKNAFSLMAIKLGVMGVTVVSSCGDDGANSYYPIGGTYCGYQPTFPASNPYVVSVGATSVSY